MNLILDVVAAVFTKEFFLLLSLLALGKTQGFSLCQVPKVKRIIDFILRNIRRGTCVLSVAQLNCDTLADLVIDHFPEICPRKQNGIGPVVNEAGSSSNYAGSPRFHIPLPSQDSLETLWASLSYMHFPIATHHPTLRPPRSHFSRT